MLFALSFIVSAIASLLGIGGGVAYVPIFLKMGYSFNLAATYSLYLVMLSASSATFRFSLENLIEWKLVALVAPMTIIGALLGAYFSRNVPSQGLLFLFAVSTSLIAFKMLTGYAHTDNQSEKTSLSYKQKLLAPLLGLGVGIYSSLIGKGGGLLFVPMLLYVYRRSLKTVAATSLATIVLTAAAGLGARVYGGVALPHQVLLAGLGCLFGAQLGVYFQVHIKPGILRRVAGGFFLLIALYIFYQVLFPFSHNV